MSSTMDCGVALLSGEIAVISTRVFFLIHWLSVQLRMYGSNGGDLHMSISKFSLLP